VNLPNPTAVLRWLEKAAKSIVDYVEAEEIALEVMVAMVGVLEVTTMMAMAEVLGEEVAAEALLVERRSHKGSQKMVVFMNAMGIF